MFSVLVATAIEDLAWPFVKQIRQISVVVFVHYHNHKLHFASGTGQIQITGNATQFPSCYPPKSWKGKHYDKLFMLCYLTSIFLSFLFKLVPCLSYYLLHFLHLLVCTSWNNPGKHLRCFQTLVLYHSMLVKTLNLVERSQRVCILYAD